MSEQPAPYAIHVLDLPNPTLTQDMAAAAMRTVQHSHDPLLSAFVAGKPVSVNAMYRPRRAGKNRQFAPTGITQKPKLLYMSQAAQDWENAVANTLMQWRQTAAAAIKHKKRANLIVGLTFYGVRADVDNLCKATLDGLKVGLAVDDRHIQSVTSSRGERASCPDPHATQGAQVTVWLI